MLIDANNAVIELYVRSIEDMGRFLFNAAMGTRQEQTQLLAEYALKAITEAANPARQSYEHVLRRGLSGINGRMAEELVAKLADKKVALLDDYRNGMLGGQRMIKEPVISVINNITNSPGAILQGGVGKLSQQINQTDVHSFVEAIKQFEDSTEVNALAEADRTALLDVVDTLRDQVQKEPRDPDRIRRWLDRFVGIATNFGVQVAAGSVVAWRQNVGPLTLPSCAFGFLLTLLSLPSLTRAIQ